MKTALQHFSLGSLETVAGVAGGVRFIPYRQGERAMSVLREVQQRLQEPDRVIPGGFLYMSDILYDWHIASRLGEIFMTRFADRNPDYIMTVETKGIPLAVMVARAFNSNRRIQTMSLTKRAIPPKSKVLLIDDFMKAGGTANGMRELVTEMGGTVVGIGVLVSTPDPKVVNDCEALLILNGVDEETRTIDIQPVDLEADKEA